MELREKLVSFYDINYRRITNVKIVMCLFVAHFSAMFLPNIIWIGLQLGKLSQKWKE